MEINNLEEYKRHVKEKLERFGSVFAKAIIGDFSENIEISEDDEFSELYTGVQTIIEAVRDKVEVLEKEIGQREDLEKMLLARNKDMTGSQKALLNVLADLEESKSKAEKERSQYEALLTSVKDGIFAIDKSGVVIFFNSAAEDILQWKSSEVMGKNIADFLEFEDEGGNKVPTEQRPYSEVIRLGKTKSLNSYYYIRKDGTRFPVSFTISPIIMDNKLVGAMEVFKDITEAKALDRAKSEFISIASHQLRTPVTAAKWLAEIFSESMDKLTPKEKEYLDDLSKSINRLSGLVEDLLNVSRIDLGTLKFEKMEIDLFGFIENFVKDMEAYLKLKKHTLKLKKEFSGDFKVEIDSKVLYNIIQNLVSNAIDYSPIETTVTILAEKEGDNAKISVFNQGPVIPEDEKRKLFQKFYRGESTKKMKADGTGLGLYIFKSNVEGSGGTVGFKSEKGEETVFWFTLPLKNK